MPGEHSGATLLILDITRLAIGHVDELSRRDHRLARKQGREGKNGSANEWTRLVFAIHSSAGGRLRGNEVDIRSNPNESHLGKNQPVQDPSRCLDRSCDYVETSL